MIIDLEKETEIILPTKRYKDMDNLELKLLMVVLIFTTVPAASKKQCSISKQLLTRGKD